MDRDAKYQQQLRMLRLADRLAEAVVLVAAVAAALFLLDLCAWGVPC